MARQVYITTVDNPWNPKTQYREWSQFDHLNGYNSNELLDRVVSTSDALSDEWNQMIIEEAIDKICELHNYSVYKKVVFE